MSTAKSNRARYARISSLHELRTERARLDVQIEMTEQRLENHYLEIKRFFSVQHIISLAMGQVSRFEAIIETVRTAWQWISSLFHRKKKEDPAPDQQDSDPQIVDAEECSCDEAE